MLETETIEIESLKHSLLLLFLCRPLAVAQPALVEKQQSAVLKGHSQVVTSVAFSSDGKTLASGDSAGVIKIWDVASTKEKGQLKNIDGWPDSIAFSPDGLLLAAGGSMPFRLWTLVTGGEVRTLKAPNIEIWAVAWSPDGRYVAFSGLSRKIWVWDFKRGAIGAILDSESEGITSLAFSQSEKVLAAGSLNGKVILWQLGNWKVIRKLEGHTDRVTAVAITGDGKKLASGSADEAVKVWEIASGRELASVRTGRDKKEWASSRAMAITANARYLAKGFLDGPIDLWDLEKKQKLTTLNGHSEAVPSLAFAPGDDMLASVSHDRTVRLWHVKKLLREKRDK